MLEVNKEFGPLNIPQKHLSSDKGDGAIAYKVYKDKDGFETVHATTASEAIEKSGIKNPFKIHRITATVSNIISGDEMAKVAESKPAQDAPAQETVASDDKKA